MRPKLQEVAALAGVSEATVSRVMNARPGVAEPTRRLVLDEGHFLYDSDYYGDDLEMKWYRVVASLGKPIGLGEVGIAVGYEKMRNAEGKMDGALVGQVLGYFSHPDERVGKTYVFPHIFAEVMQSYMVTHGVSEEDLAAISVQESKS